MATARMQQYNMEYIPSKKNANTDILSRLPVDKPGSASPDEIASVCMLTVNELPTSQQIAEATRKATILAKVYDHTLHGCARDDEMYPFFVRKEELSLEDRYIVWGRRFIIPST